MASRAHCSPLLKLFVMVVEAVVVVAIVVVVVVAVVVVLVLVLVLVLPHFLESRSGSRGYLEDLGVRLEILGVKICLRP